jgi:hypothetical protein
MQGGAGSTRRAAAASATIAAVPRLAPCLIPRSPRPASSPLAPPQYREQRREVGRGRPAAGVWGRPAGRERVGAAPAPRSETGGAEAPSPGAPAAARPPRRRGSTTADPPCPSAPRPPQAKRQAAQLKQRLGRSLVLNEYEQARGGAAWARGRAQGWLSVQGLAGLAGFAGSAGAPWAARPLGPSRPAPRSAFGALGRRPQLKARDGRG